jgi:mevalonate kinase
VKENSIEEAIKIMEHWVEYEKNNKEKINRADELINIQETILSDYKRVLKENAKLKNQEATQIQKIKDKIERIQEEGYWLFTTDRDSDKCVEVLQELLGGKEQNK